MTCRSVLLALFLLASFLPMADDAAAAAALYPDLKTTPPSGLYFDRVTMGDGLSHYVVRFSNVVWNAGEGRLELQGDPNPSGSNKIYQNFYDARTGGTRVLQRQVSSDIIYHPSHYHYHFEAFASYLLLQRDASGVYQPTTKKGTKTSFCVLDVTRTSSTGVPYGAIRRLRRNTPRVVRRVGRSLCGFIAGPVDRPRHNAPGRRSVRHPVHRGPAEQAR